MVGILRAWKVSVDAGVLRAVREAEVRVDQIGECIWAEGAAWRGEVGFEECDVDRLSFVAAIWVRRDARSLRRSVEE